MYTIYRKYYGLPDYLSHCMENVGIMSEKKFEL